MKSLKISGKDLGKVIHVDESLISKWKSGKRALKPGSHYAEKIAEHILSMDEPSKYAHIYKHLAGYYENIMQCSEKELLMYFKSWLTDETDAGGTDAYDEVRNSGYTDTNISYCFKDEEGRRQATEFLNKYVLAQDTPCEIISFTTESGKWFREDDAFYLRWKTQHNELIESGHFISLIQPVNRSYGAMAESIVRWLPLHMTGKVIDSYIPDYVSGPINYTYFVVPGHIAVWGLSSKNYTKRINTWVSNEKDIVENLSNIIKEYLNKAIPLFERFYYDSKTQYLNELTGMMQRRSQKYYHGSVTMYMPISADLIEEILLSNGVSEKNIALAVKTYEFLTSLNLSERNRYIININTLSQLLEEDRIALLPLSFILGETVYTDRSAFVCLLREFIEGILSSDLIEIALLDESQKDDYADINVLAQEGNRIHFMSTRGENPFVMSVSEPTVVVAMIERTKNMWGGIPSRMKEKEYVTTRILELLDGVH
jgi:transcriptional regulator with XRE-family HTH domain